VGHRAVLHGCTIEDHCLIGMGAVLVNNVRMGEGSIVAAGALVLEGTIIPPQSPYLGSPARFRRRLAEDDRRFIDGHTAHYLQYKEVYVAEREKMRVLTGEIACRE